MIRGAKARAPGRIGALVVAQYGNEKAFEGQ
jgi:hypothetical protein